MMKMGKKLVNFEKEEENRANHWTLKANMTIQ
jgi:hypothetical protein